MARAKAKSAEVSPQMELKPGPQPAAPVAVPVEKPPGYTGPALVQYPVAGDLWRCNHVDWLLAEFPELTPPDLARFQEIVAAQARSWLIVRRLFGMQPVIPPADYNPDDFREWNRNSLREAMGLTPAQMAAELAAVRGMWLAIKPPAPAPAATPPPALPAMPKDELPFQEEALLAQYGFNMAFESMEEKAWFAQRVQDFAKLLSEAMTRTLARNTLMTELQIRQIDAFLGNAERNRVGTADWRANNKVRQELAGTYERQLAQINELAPWAGAVTGKYNFANALSDLTRAIQEYHARGDTRLIDGIFTANEIQVQCRRSVQAREPQYRAGLVVYLNAAKAGLWDPHWRSPFQPARLKQLDQAWKAAAMAISDQMGERLPDLEKTGPENEYPALTADLGETSKLPSPAL